jgi:hypothetical protein
LPFEVVVSPLKVDIVDNESACPQLDKTEFVVDVRLATCDGVALADVPVECERLGTARKTLVGVVYYGMVAPGDYTIVVHKEGYRYVEGQERSPAFKRLVTLTAGHKVRVIVALEPEVSLFLDANRVGDDTALTNGGIKNWSWGKNGRGAIALCNNNDSDRTGSADNTDARINGANDLLDIAPLDVRSLLSVQEILTLGDAQIMLAFVVPGDALRLRIFNGRQPASTQLLGPGAELLSIWKTAVSRHGYASCLELGMEAIRYDLHVDEEPIQLRLRFIVSGIELVSMDGAVRVAPWMMQHHLIAPLEIYAIEGGQKKANEPFRKALAEAVGSNPVKPVWLPYKGGDLWAQDCMEFGSSCLPKHAVSTVVPAPRRTGSRA